MGKKKNSHAAEPKSLPPVSRQLSLAPGTEKKELTSYDPLQIYLQEIKKFPMLEMEEEFELGRRIQEKKDQEAAFRLTSANLRLVVKIAMTFQRRWMRNVLDLIQEGNVGLMKAVQKFDPEKGIRFSYYASFWIKAYILKFIMDNWRMVKVGTTQAQRKLFYNLGKERQRLEAQGITPDSMTLSSNLNVSENEIVEMGQRLGQNDLSLDMRLGDDDSFTALDFIPALGPSVDTELAQEEMHGLLHDQLKKIKPTLNEKEKAILAERLLAETPITLRELGEKYGITRERVRQIESKLLQKIRGHLSENIFDFSKDWITEESSK